MYVSRNTEARSRNHCCSRKAKSITYSECVFLALVIRHAKRMRLAVLSSVASMSVLYFTTSHKHYDFREKNYWNIKYILIFSNIFVRIIPYFK
jgi:hypothetical protein